MIQLLEFALTVKETLKVIAVSVVFLVTMEIQPQALTVFHASALFSTITLVQPVSLTRLTDCRHVIIVLRDIQEETVKYVWMDTLEVHW